MATNKEKVIYMPNVRHYKAKEWKKVKHPTGDLSKWHWAS